MSSGLLRGPRLSWPALSIHEDIVTCRAFRFLIGAALLSLPGALPALATTLPAGFVVDDVVPGVTFDVPTGFAFLPGGRMLVAEKRGRLWAVDHGARHPTPM